MAANDLDDAYANASHIRGGDGFPAIWMRDSAIFRERMGARSECDIAYGAHPRERLDLFRPAGEAQGLVVFVHGGFWRSFDKGTWSHFAEGALKAGWAVAMPSYVLAPEDRISAITAQVRAAIEQAAGLVAGPIRLTGHSAGGHLVARMLCADAAPAEAVARRIVRVVPISGLFDLRPLMRTSLNDDLQLTEAEAEAESPILSTRPLPVPVTAWVGGAERPAFVQQTRDFAAAWPRASMGVDMLSHHFDVIDGLRDPASPLMRALLA